MASSDSYRIHLIVLAGGRSTRAQRGDASAPKQFRRIGDDMLLLWSLRELLAVSEVVSLTVTVPESWAAVTRTALEDAGLAVPFFLADAGADRSASTWNALQVLAAENAPLAEDLVAVHDAARPFATQHLLKRVADAAARHGAAVPGVPVPDTIVQIVQIARTTQATQTTQDTSEAGQALAEVAYLQRETLQAVQTPQVFRWEIFHAAHQWCAAEQRSYTDDGGLVAARGLAPVVVMGETDNWKVTTESDWRRAAAQLRKG